MSSWKYCSSAMRTTSFSAGYLLIHLISFSRVTLPYLDLLRPLIGSEWKIYTEEVQTVLVSNIFLLSIASRGAWLLLRRTSKPHGPKLDCTHGTQIEFSSVSQNRQTRNRKAFVL